MTQDKIPFNKWSKERIAQGRKFCTSRNVIYDDERVDFVAQFPLWIVTKYLWQIEGADSPEEFKKIWRAIHRGKYQPHKMVWVHFGDFR